MGQVWHSKLACVDIFNKTMSVIHRWWKRAGLVHRAPKLPAEQKGQALQLDIAYDRETSKPDHILCPVVGSDPFVLLAALELCTPSCNHCPLASPIQHNELECVVCEIGRSLPMACLLDSERLLVCKLHTKESSTIKQTYLGKSEIGCDQLLGLLETNASFVITTPSSANLPYMALLGVVMVELSFVSSNRNK